MPNCLILKSRSCCALERRFSASWIASANSETSRPACVPDAPSLRRSDASSADALLAAALPELSRFDGTDFSTAFSSLAKLPDSVCINKAGFDKLVEEALWRVSDFLASDLSTTAWAFATMKSRRAAG